MDLVESKGSVSSNRERYLASLSSVDGRNVGQLLNYIDALARDIEGSEIRIVVIGSTVPGGRYNSRSPTDIDLQILSTTLYESPSRVQVSKFIEERLLEFFNSHGYRYNKSDEVDHSSLGFMDESMLPFVNNPSYQAFPSEGHYLDLTFSGKSSLDAQYVIDLHRKVNRPHLVVK